MSSRPTHVTWTAAVQRGCLAAAAALALVVTVPGQASAAEYRFTKVADSAGDGFDPNNFGCSSVNRRGDVGFRAGRVAPDGFNTVEASIERTQAAAG